MGINSLGKERTVKAKTGRQKQHSVRLRRTDHARSQQQKFPERERQGMELERPAEVRTQRACHATLGSLPLGLSLLHNSASWLAGCVTASARSRYY